MDQLTTPGSGRSRYTLGSRRAVAFYLRVTVKNVRTWATSRGLELDTAYMYRVPPTCTACCHRAAGCGTAYGAVTDYRRRRALSRARRGRHAGTRPPPDVQTTEGPPARQPGVSSFGLAATSLSSRSTVRNRSFDVRGRHVLGVVGAGHRHRTPLSTQLATCAGGRLAHLIRVLCFS